jgi:hypothetical protein
MEPYRLANKIHAIVLVHVPRMIPHKEASPRSTVEMIGPPFVTRRELQQLPACSGETTLAGQRAQPVRHFSIVRSVNRQRVDPWLVHR